MQPPLTSIPSRTPIAALAEHIGARVRVCGLVEAVRDQKRMQFAVLSDATGQAQIAHEKVRTRPTRWPRKSPP